MAFCFLLGLDYVISLRRIAEIDISCCLDLEKVKSIRFTKNVRKTNVSFLFFLKNLRAGKKIKPSGSRHTADLRKSSLPLLQPEHHIKTNTSNKSPLKQLLNSVFTVHFKALSSFDVAHIPFFNLAFNAC